MISMVESSNFVCSRSGRATFSPTVIEPNRAPPWNDIPIFSRISFISCDEIAAIFFPLSQISPELGLSRPTRVRSSVLLPEPDPPRITRVSPRITSKPMPWRISRSPNVTRRFRKEIIASGCAAALLVCSMAIFQTLPFTHEEKERGENEVHQDYQKYGNHHRARG